MSEELRAALVLLMVLGVVSIALNLLVAEAIVSSRPRRRR